MDEGRGMYPVLQCSSEAFVPALSIGVSSLVPRINRFRERKALRVWWKGEEISAARD